MKLSFSEQLRNAQRTREQVENEKNHLKINLLNKEMILKTGKKNEINNLILQSYSNFVTVLQDACVEAASKALYVACHEKTVIYGRIRCDRVESSSDWNYYGQSVCLSVEIMLPRKKFMKGYFVEDADYQIFYKKSNDNYVRKQLEVYSTKSTFGGKCHMCYDNITKNNDLPNYLSSNLEAFSQIGSWHAVSGGNFTMAFPFKVTY